MVSDYDRLTYRFLDIHFPSRFDNQALFSGGYYVHVTTPIVEAASRRQGHPSNAQCKYKKIRVILTPLGLAQASKWQKMKPEDHVLVTTGRVSLQADRSYNSLKCGTFHKLKKGDDLLHDSTTVQQLLLHANELIYPILELHRTEEYGGQVDHIRRGDNGVWSETNCNDWDRAVVQAKRCNGIM